MITYPTSIDSLTNPTSGNTLASPDHAQQHSDVNDAVEALEAKVGANSSVVTTSHDYKLSAVTSSAKALTSGTSTQSVTGLTLTTPVINVGSDTTGDIYYRSSGGTFTRLAIGSSGQILSVSLGIPSWIPNPAASDASTTVKGVVEIATAAEINAGTATGSTGAVLAISPDQLALSSYTPLNIFGDGSDGNVTIASNTTLTSDKYYNNLTVNNGIILSTGGYRVFVKGTLTLTGTGTIENSGNTGGTGGNASAGAGGTAGTASSAAVAVTVFSTGGAGGAGSAGTGQAGGGSAGTSSTAVTNSVGVIGGNGGSGAISGGAGGSAGSVTLSAINGIHDPITAIQEAILGLVFKAGTSGGGGGGGGSTGAASGSAYGGGGGGGGSAGGVLLIAANTLSGSGVLKSIGGNGGNGGNGNVGNATGGFTYGGGGGGGGGAGGVIILLTKTASNPYTMTLTGGSAGTGGTGSTSGTTGTPGNTGSSYFITV